MKKIVLYTFMIAVISACSNSEIPATKTGEEKPVATNAPSADVSMQNQSTTTAQSAVPAGSINSGSVSTTPSKPAFSYSGAVKEVIFFSPTSEELVAITANENDDTQRILIENFEFNSNKFIESTPFEGYNYRFYEMREIVLPMPEGKMFRLVRNKPELLCGVILYDGIKEPKVLKGDLKGADYQREAKLYFK